MQFVARMTCNRYRSAFSLMFELTMAAFCAVQNPAVFFNDFDDFADFYFKISNPIAALGFD
jgi:hypothetical protein